MVEGDEGLRCAGELGEAVRVAHQDVTADLQGESGELRQGRRGTAPSGPLANA